MADSDASRREQFWDEQAGRLNGLKGADREAMILKIRDEWFASPEGALELAEAIEKVDDEGRAKIEHLNAEHRRVLMQQAATKLAGSVAIQGSSGLLEPLILERLVTVDGPDGPVVAVKDKAGAVTRASLDSLAEEFRADPALARVVRGASIQEKAAHQQRVAAILGKPPTNSGVAKSLSRAEFQALAPDGRVAHMNAGGKITD